MKKELSPETNTVLYSMVEGVPAKCGKGRSKANQRCGLEPVLTGSGVGVYLVYHGMGCVCVCVCVLYEGAVGMRVKGPDGGCGGRGVRTSGHAGM